MNAVLLAGVSAVLAEAGPDKAPANNPEWGKAAPTGLFVLLVFIVACFFLFRSMNRHIKRVPENFRGDGPEQEPGHLGEAKPAVPVREETDAEPTAAEQTALAAPRLGTPEQLVDRQRAKRHERIRKARERHPRTPEA